MISDLMEKDDDHKQNAGEGSGSVPSEPEIKSIPAIKSKSQSKIQPPPPPPPPKSKSIFRKIDFSTSTSDKVAKAVAPITEPNGDGVNNEVKGAQLDDTDLKDDLDRGEPMLGIDIQIQGTATEDPALTSLCVEGIGGKDKDNESCLSTLADPSLSIGKTSSLSAGGVIPIPGKRPLSTKVHVPPGFQDQVLELLHCLSCNEVAFPPIFNCKKGHLTCSSCRKNKKNCKVCRSRFTKKRNLYIESIAGLLQHKCSFTLCPEVFVGSLINDHKITCEFRPVNCMERNKKVCQGTLVNLEDYEDHLQTVHASKTGELKCSEDSICFDFSFANWKSARFDACVLKFDGKAFILQLTRTTESEFCLYVSLIGSEADATTYVANIRVEKTKEQFPCLQWSGMVHALHTGLKALQELGDVFHVSTKVASPFCHEIWGAKGKLVEYRLTVYVRLENKPVRDTETQLELHPENFGVVWKILKTMRSHWRDSKEWDLQGLHLSTPSNEACKLYDASLSQLVGWYDDRTLGGMEKSLEQMINSDTQFVMGKALAYGLELIGTGTSFQQENSEIVLKIKSLESLSEKQKGILTQREMDHVEALKFWSKGNLEKAAQVWEDILISNPTDMHAIKMAEDTYFYLGQQTQMRDCIARVLPQWNKDLPLQSYLYGMYAFGLVETNLHDEAEKNALIGLERNKNDAWSTHALAHVYEMTGQFDRGIQFLDKTLSDWEICNYLSCHTFWHLAIYHVEKNEHEGALEIFENKICPAVKSSGAMLDYVDASSLLYRLQLEDVEVGKKCWDPIYRVAKKHKDDHVLIFNDAHFLMAFLGNQDDELATEFFACCKEFMKNGKGDQHILTQEVGTALLEAMLCYDKKDYERATDLLNSVKYKIIKIGGSNAQRDIFNILLLNAAVRSSTPFHLQLARSLLNERIAKKPNSPLTNRIAERLKQNLKRVQNL